MKYIQKMNLQLVLFVLSIGFALNSIHAINVDSCQFSLVESIPEGVNFTNQANNIELPLIKDELLSLVQNARSSIDVAEFYFTLRCADVVNTSMATCQPGEKLLQSLIDAAKRKVQVRIAVNGKREKDMNEDLKLLKAAGAQIKFLDFDQLVGAGILHTKMMIFDQVQFFLGSANMDWRSLTQVKEIGITTNKCAKLTKDLSKIFDIYWLVGDKKVIPKPFPPSTATTFNVTNPMSIQMNGVDTSVFLTSSPKSFCAQGRTDDLTGLLSVVNGAKKYLYLSVMDYAPFYLYGKHHWYWDVIDSAIRKAVVSRGVKVRFMLGYWVHTRPDILKYLQSLGELQNMTLTKGEIQVRLFKVPITDPSQKLIPYARVNHAKFMLSESHAFIGTSNWSADYFESTGGVSIIASCASTDDQSCIRDELEAVFDRDWTSQYAHYLNSSSTSN